MNTERYQLIAYLATLATLVGVFVAALTAAVISPGLIGRLEAFGLGTITGGLIGVLRMPIARSPVAQTESGDVSVTPAPKAEGA